MPALVAALGLHHTGNDRLVSAESKIPSDYRSQPNWRGRVGPRVINADEVGGLNSLAGSFCGAYQGSAPFAGIVKKDLWSTRCVIIFVVLTPLMPCGIGDECFLVSDVAARGGGHFTKGASPQPAAGRADSRLLFQISLTRILITVSRSMRYPLFR
jgi:hypothetical protein